MIVYILKDGLGNQFFEYAYAKKLQEETGEEVAFCTWLYNLKNFSLNKTRQCSLQHFCLPEDTKVLSGIENFTYFVSFMLRLALVYKKDFISWFVKGKRVSRKQHYENDCKKGLYISEETFFVPEYIPSKKKTKYIFGNYEGATVFPKNIDQLKEELQVKTLPNEDNQKMLQKIFSEHNSVCMHVRRGDYLNKGNEWLQVCDYDYYKNAVKYIKGKVENPTFFIFSNTHDDIEWIKENYKFDMDPIYVDLSNPDYEEIRLMMSCKHFIISNSTFSWWASLLSKNEGKLIVAPKTWSNKNDNSDIMLREEFVLI